MRRVYIEKFTGLEGAKLVDGQVVPSGDEIWFNPDTGAIFKKTADGAVWGHLLHVLGHEFQLKEFPIPLPEKGLYEIIKADKEAQESIEAIEAAIPAVAVNSAPGKAPIANKRGRAPKVKLAD